MKYVTLNEEEWNLIQKMIKAAHDISGAVNAGEWWINEIESSQEGREKEKIEEILKEVEVSPYRNSSPIYTIEKRGMCLDHRHAAVNHWKTDCERDISVYVWETETSYIDRFKDNSGGMWERRSDGGEWRDCSTAIQDIKTICDKDLADLDDLETSL